MASFVNQVNQGPEAKERRFIKVSGAHCFAVARARCRRSVCARCCPPPHLRAPPALPPCARAFTTPCSRDRPGDTGNPDTSRWQRLWPARGHLATTASPAHVASPLLLQSWGGGHGHERSPRTCPSCPVNPVGLCRQVAFPLGERNDSPSFTPCPVPLPVCTELLAAPAVPACVQMSRRAFPRAAVTSLLLCCKLYFH